MPKYNMYKKPNNYHFSCFHVHRCIHWLWIELHEWVIWLLA